MFQEWDNGTKANRGKLLEDFIKNNSNQTGPELELEFAQAASLFFARITAWMRLRLLTLLFFSIFIIWKENHPLNVNVFLLKQFTCQLRISECTDGSNLKIFLSPNYSKFAVECD